METKEPAFTRIFNTLDTKGRSSQCRNPSGDSLSHSRQHSLSSLTLSQSKQREAQMQEIDKLEVSEDFHKSNAIHILREKELEIQTLLEEMTASQSRCMETQDALSEAQTIIEQLQNQLDEVRLRAAQCATDAENFKLKYLFLSKSGDTTKPNEQYLYDLCEQLEAEVKDLRRQLGQSSRAQISLENQNEYLKRQLENHIRSHSASPNPSVDESGFAESHLSVPQRSVQTPRQLQQHYEEIQQRMVELEAKHQEEINAYERELDNLHAEVDSWYKKEQEWNETHQKLLERQQDLEDERKAQNRKVEILKAQNTTLSRASSAMSILQSGPDTDYNRQMRKATDERNRWKSYACGLVRTLVENCPEFMKKTKYDEPEFSTVAERRWYDYAMYLLELLLDAAPHRLTERDMHLLEQRKPSRVSSVSPTSAYSGSQEVALPELLSAVNLRPISPRRQNTTSRVARLARKSLFRPSKRL